ncbi:MAG: TonB-dependent receptor [Prolixibacteraceae bacterium]|jgi:TonB-linked SusC/RagA family outer membrane protein
MKKKYQNPTRGRYDWLRKLFMIMKLTFFLILVSTLLVSAGAYSQNTKLSLDYKNISISQLLQLIEEQTEYRFAYSKSRLNPDERIDIDVKNEALDQIMKIILDKDQLTYKIIDRYVVISDNTSSDSNSSQQQKKTISGKVTDTTGSPLPGVTVFVKGTTLGAITDSNGNYSLSNIPDNATLQFSFVGMKSQEVSVTGKTKIDITMKEEAVGIEEVVAIGYGSSRKKDLVGSVASVEASKINSQTVQNVTQALQGKVAGLQITNNGTPGSSPQVRLRGLGTVTDGSGPLYVVDEVIVPNISFLAPGDIENVTVLKDASSAAIYGVRAAGGVILITTKKGTDSKPTISFNSYVGIKKAANIVDIANGPEYIQMYNEALQYRGLTSGLLDPSKYSSHNYYDDILNNNIVTNSQDLTILGGTSSAKYSIGFSHLKDDGLVKDDNYSRIGFRAKYDVSINDKLRVGFSTVLSSAKSNPQANSMASVQRVLPIFQPKDANGNWTDPTSIKNVINLAAAHYYDKNSFQTALNAILNGYAELDLLKNLTLKSSISLNPGEVNYIKYSPLYKVSVYQSQQQNILTKTRGQNLNINWDNTVTYSMTIAEDHHLKLLGGMSYQEQQINNLNATASGLQDLPEISSSYLFLSYPGRTDKYTTASSDGGDKTVANSYFGRINYDYKGKYLFNATLRNDISTKFPKNNRSALFPSVGGAWVASSEEFMKKSKIDFLKVRASWGLIGNGIIPSNIYVPTLYTDNYGAVIFGPNQNNATTADVSPIATINQLANPNLKWETVSEFDAGVDVRFIQNCLSVTADYYSRDTRDAIFPISALPSTGLNTNGVWGNNATINNSGLEFTLGWADHKGDFSYSLNGNFSYNQNKVTALSAASAAGIYGKASGYSATYTYSTIGHPVGEIYGLQAIGVFQNTAQIASTPHVSGALPGDLIFEDLNKDGIIDDRDRTFLGNPNPPFFYGFDASLGYKGFDLAIAIQGVAGNKLVNAVDIERFGGENYTKRFFDNRWHGEGTSNTFPSAVLANTTQNSSFFVESGSYLRLKNIQLGYTFNAKILSKMGIKKLRLYVSGENIHTFTKYSGTSPEVTGGPIFGGVNYSTYPLSTVYSFGLNLNF